MKDLKSFLVIIAIFIFLGLSAQQEEGYRLKQNVYESILDALFDAKNLNVFDYQMNQVDFERKARVFSSDRKTYSIETILPENEKMLTSYLYPSGEVIRVSFLHHTDLYHYIENYLNQNAKKEGNLWANYKGTIILSYEIEGAVALLNVFSASYDW